MANCKAQFQEGWFRSHVVCSEVWYHSRNHLQNDTPSWYALGATSDLPFSTYTFLWTLTEKYITKLLTHMYS